MNGLARGKVRQVGMIEGMTSADPESEDDIPSDLLAAILPSQAKSHLLRLYPESGLPGHAKPSMRQDRSDMFAKREAHYRMGRHCASMALRSLARTAEIPKDGAGRPVWPQGIVGSITHSDFVVAAAVAEASSCEALGIDAETLMNNTVRSEVFSIISNSIERDIGKSAGIDDGMSCTLIFSCKESLYKCLNPLTDKFFEFEHARILELDMEASSFKISLMIDLSDRFAAGSVYEGKFLFHGDHVYTALAIAP